MNLIHSGIMPISQEFHDVTLVKKLLEDPVLYQWVMCSAWVARDYGLLHLKFDNLISCA